MYSWKDICRESNGPDVCETQCVKCYEEAQRRRTSSFLLPGTPRDLPTVEDHLERAHGTAIKLWAHKEMQLRHCKDGAELEDATELLRNIRHDIGVLVSCLHQIQKERNDG